MDKNKLDQLVDKKSDALEACYVAEANSDSNRPDEIYFLAEAALARVIGAVFVKTASGRLKRFDLIELQF